MHCGHGTCRSSGPWVDDPICPLVIARIQPVNRPPHSWSATVNYVISQGQPPTNSKPKATNNFPQTQCQLLGLSAKTCAYVGGCASSAPTLSGVLLSRCGSSAGSPWRIGVGPPCSVFPYLPRLDLRDSNTISGVTSRGGCLLVVREQLAHWERRDSCSACRCARRACLSALRSLVLVPQSPFVGVEHPEDVSPFLASLDSFPTWEGELPLSHVRVTGRRHQTDAHQDSHFRMVDQSTILMSEIC
jgi:hypothetical protein